MSERETVKASELMSGDFFSYVGSFKVYQVKQPPRKSKMFPNKVVVIVTDGDRNTNMGCRLNQDAECQLHESFGDRRAR